MDVTIKIHLFQIRQYKTRSLSNKGRVTFTGISTAKI